jgi:hypothetical protein
LRTRATLCLGSVLGILLAATAGAQTPVTTDTLTSGEFPERSAWEQRYLSQFNMDREPQGGREIAMGGTGIASAGGPESYVLNPAAILGVLRPQLTAEAKILAGGAKGINVPSRLDLGQGNFLDASNYRIHARQGFTYHNLSLGIPVVMLGNRGALGLSYHRVALTGRQEETRVELEGSITNQQAATFGLGDLPDQGMDAITVTAARKITSFADLGVNLNWMSGTLERSKQIGVSVLGFELYGGSLNFSQDVSGFNVDAGTRLEFGPLSLGGTLLMSHDLKFTGAKAVIRPLPDPTDPGKRTLIDSNPVDNTLSVPTMVGLGGAYRVGDRLTLAADYWLRPWNKATISRTRLEPIVGFADPADSSTYGFVLIPADNDSLWNLYSPSIDNPQNKTDTFNAGLWNTNSIRLGAEYFLVKREDLQIPVRVGFRKERRTVTGVALSDTLIAHYQKLINDYWHAVLDDSPNKTALENELKRAAESGPSVFQGDPVSAKTISLGIGFQIQEWEVDLSWERTSYDVQTYFLQDFDPVLNPQPAVVAEHRSLTNLVLSASMRF